MTKQQIIERLVIIAIENASERAGCSDGDTTLKRKWLKLARSNKLNDHKMLLERVSNLVY